jgi:branched-chain amino acid transport system substrate-binding protein
MCRRLAAIVCALIALGLSSCAAPSPLRETSPVRIGFFGDLSSTGARDGNDALKGVELRVGTANASGGIGGRPIELVVRDTKQSSPEAVKSFTQLAQDEGVCAVIGAVVPSSGLSVSPVADLSKVPLVSLATDDRVATPDLKPENPDPPGSARQFAFQLQASATQVGASFAGYAVEHFTMKRYATLYEAVNPVSVMQAHAFENVVRKSGKTVAASVVLPEGDMSTAVRALRDADVDAVYICGTAEQDAAAAKSLRAGVPQAVLLVNQAWYAAGTVGSGAVFDESANGAWFCMAVSPDDPGLAVIAPSFETRFGEKPRTTVIPGWDAAGLVIAAVRKAGTANPLRVRDALEGMTAFQGLQGVFDMDRKTHRPALLPVAIMRFMNGAYATTEARYTYKPARAP